MDLEEVDLGIEIAVPCGLILNELITNAVKHAFPDGRTGEIRIVLQAKEDDTVLLRVSDNGVGLPADLDEAQTMSLGIRLIRILTNQVHGQCDFVRTGSGLEVRLAFRRS